MIDFKNGSIIKLSKTTKDVVGSDITALFVENEYIVSVYQSIRDFVLFTNYRIISTNTQGLSGAKVDYTSMPYNKIQVFSIETAGVFDLDCELELYFTGLGKVKFEFYNSEDIHELGKYISCSVLEVNEEDQHLNTKSTSISITNKQPLLPFSPLSVKIIEEQNKAFCALEIEDFSKHKISAISATIEFRNIFDEKISTKLYFTNFCSENLKYVSQFSKIDIPETQIHILKDANLFVDKFISDGNIVDASSISDSEITKFADAKEAFLRAIESIATTAGILNYAKEFNQKFSDAIPEEVIHAISSCVQAERLYGNMRNDCIKQVTNLLSKF